MKLRDLVNSKEILEYLSKQRFPTVFTFRLRGFIREISPILLEYENIRNEKVILYGEKIGDTDQWKVKEENMGIFIKDMNELLDASVNVKEFKIHHSYLEDHKIILSVQELEILDWLID